MRTVSREEIGRRLDEVGLRRNDTVFVYSDLRCIGPVAGARDREAFCDAYLSAMLDVVGPGGTVAVPTYTTQVARFDLDFVWESTQSAMGIFPEHVRSRQGAVRSLHPLFSLTALGANAGAICSDNGTSSHGVDSPFARLLEHDALILSIGLDRIYAVGVAHHLEAACSLPYCYNKLLKWRPIVGGKPIDRAFFATVRYPEFLKIPYDLNVLLEAVAVESGLKSAPLGRSVVCSSRYRHAFNVGRMLLRDRPYMLLAEEPAFVYGEIPFDGPTAGRDSITAPGDLERLANMNWLGFYL
jgi:Aminoglycoside N3''-acetyltransferase